MVLLRLSFFMALLSVFVQAQEQSQSPHCGFDFNSYLVVETFVNNHKTMVPTMRITVVDENFNDIVNSNNQYSLIKNDKILLFTENYKTEGNKWFFPYAHESYLLLIALNFPNDGLNIKVEDTLGNFKKQFIPINYQNFYKLCTSENALQLRKFGPKTNVPIQVHLAN